MVVLSIVPILLATAVLVYLCKLESRELYTEMYMTDDH